MEWNWTRAGEEDLVLQLNEQNQVPFFMFPLLKETGLVKHGFSTKMGGVSEGKFATMNFTFSRGDNPIHVIENYRRMAEALEVDVTRMVLSNQTHTTNVRMVTEADCGKGIFCDRDYKDVDGLITDVPGITLVTFYADCVPLYFLDPIHRAVGLSHSGWRGTVGRMGESTLKAMREAYGTTPKDVIACIGPSICQSCYEVGEEVAGRFREAFAPAQYDSLFYGKDDGKFMLNLWKANQIVLEEAGVPASQIQITDICTRCNCEYLFSHRDRGNERGNLGAFLCLR